MKKLLVAMAVTAGFTSTALAADMAVRTPVYKAPPPVAVTSWTGCYVGGGGGYGMYNQQVSTVGVTGGAITRVDRTDDRWPRLVRHGTSWLRLPVC